MIKHLLITLMLLATTACSTIESVNEYMPWYSGNQVQSVGLQVSAGATMDHAISVDVIFAYDENLLALLSGMSSEQWFKEKQGYLASYGVNMDVIQRQIVPGYSEHILNLPGRSHLAGGVFAFALYPNNPNAKAVLSATATPWLIFDEVQMNVLAAPPSAPSGGNVQ